MGELSQSMHADHMELAPAEYQRRMLPFVSRTFALTIPQLPSPLDDIVTNAYLLCRIADTVEDDPGLTAVDKSRAHEEFLAVLRGESDARAFGRRIGAALSAKTSPHERELIHRSGRVIAYTQSLDNETRDALLRCVAIMCEGMSEYQRSASPSGLKNMEDVNRYCYYVAGVVGEMLTELFTLHLPDVRPCRGRMLALSRSFGEGLQLTNILKDIWEDRRRGACWLPRDVFADHGTDLEAVHPETVGPGYARAMDYMVGVAHEHLRDAMRYTLLLPAGEVGTRRFCLWAIGMAVLTLRRIHRHPLYQRGDQVKIPRWMVKAVIIGSSITARYDRLLRGLFALVTTGLPRHREPIDPAVSRWEEGSTMGYDVSLAAGHDVPQAQTHRMRTVGGSE